MTEQWQELKETIIELRDNDGVGTQQEVCNFLANYMEVLEKQMTDGWIPVSEKLPKDYGEYICTMSDGNIQECGFVPSGEKGLISGWSTCEADGFKKLDYRDIKAWQPLPEPYVPDTNDGNKAESEVTNADSN